MTSRVLFYRCFCDEYLVDPLGVDNSEPRLSWLVESDQRRQQQTAYHILVATCPERLEKGIGDLWDTGKVESDQTSQIAYAGVPLRSRTECYWKVRVWDKDSSPSNWSDVSRWTVGLLAEDD